MAKTNTQSQNLRSHLRALLKAGASKKDVLRDQQRLLRFIWGASAQTKNDAFGNLCFRRKGAGEMIDKFVDLSDQIKVKHLLRRYDRNEFDQYFSPNTYVSRNRKVNNVRMTHLGWCDVDKADPFAFNPKPSLVWQTSPGNTQALWLWDREYTPAEAQAFSKALAYRFSGDKGGHAPNKLLRLPGSFNHKPAYDTPFIPLLHFDPKPIAERPKLLTGRDSRAGVETTALTINPHRHDRRWVLRKYRTKLRSPVGSLLQHDRVCLPDRSLQIFTIIAGLHAAKASIDEIAGAVWSSPYFIDKYGANERALQTEVSRIISKLEANQ